MKWETSIRSETLTPESELFLIKISIFFFFLIIFRFMPPDDPLGRHGPSLDNFLRKKPVVPEHKKQQCPYGKICLLNIKTSVPIRV